MPLLLIRYQVAEKGVAEVIRATEATFQAVRDEQPEGIRYLYLHRPGGNEFVALLELNQGLENPLPGIEAARHLQATVAQWVEGGAPTPQPLEVIGSYGFTR
ncbi:hypothetical protein GCM10010191_65320 [Actinomadura vinacea]|uniref:Antibiotic biosynthesis monooxygenase n=1 Tax=Actinomadura vinacea TaxID=115336 RepID=A0ABN3JVB8_9ACTN